jgi:hypothetical protein
MNAALALHVQLSLRLDAIEAYRLAHAYRDEELQKFADRLASRASLYGDSRTVGEVIRDLRQIAGAKDSPTVEPSAGSARASIHAMFPLGEAATAELDLRLDAHRAESAAAVLHQAADEIDTAQNRLVAKKTVVNILRRRANQAREKVAAEVTAAPTLTVYRASHDSIVMGLYTTAAEARKHCEAEERHSWGKSEKPTFDWIEDEEDGVAEMTAFVGGEEFVTGYEVTALEISAKYDEEADA